MNDLSHDPARDRTIVRELERAQIDVIRLDKPTGEMPSRVRGKLGLIEFTRGVTGWIADGSVPLDVAQLLYRHPIARRDVRVGGSVERPPPDGAWVVWYTRRGERVYPVTYQAGILGTVEPWLERVPGSVAIRCHDYPAQIAALGYIDLYHIDSADGLQIFASTLRAHRIDQQARPVWWERHTLPRSQHRMACVGSVGEYARSGAAPCAWDGDTQPMSADNE